jgi:hypothetical protein
VLGQGRDLGQDVVPAPPLTPHPGRALSSARRCNVRRSSPRPGEQAARPEPATPEPANPEPATPEPANPEPATPEPANPEPANPEPATPEPVGQELVRKALADAASIGAFFALIVGDGAPDGRPAAAVYRDLLSGVIATTRARQRVTEDRVAASTIHLDYAARLWSPVLCAALQHGVVPDLTGLVVRPGPPMRPSLPRPAGWQAADHGDLAALAYRTVVGLHLEPLSRGLPVKIAPGLLRGNAASAMTGALRVLTSIRPGLLPPARAMAQALLATGMLRGTGELTGPGLDFMRRSCCLFYRVPGGGWCGDCPLSGHRSQPR